MKTKIMDLGNFSVKTMNGVDFITSFKEVDSVAQLVSNVLELEGKKYEMESEHAVFDPKYNKANKNYLPNLIWALEKMEVENGDKLRLILGLPVENTKQDETIKKDLEGKSITYKVNEDEKTISIEEVGVVGEGISSFYMLPSEIREQDVILFDIGGRTFNIVEYKKGKLVRRITIPRGCIDFYDRVRIDYNNNSTEDGNLTTEEIAYYTLDNKIDISEELKYNFIDEELFKVAQRTFDFRFRKLAFTGGGSILFKDSIAKIVKDPYFMENPRFTNVNGNKRIAKAKGWIK